VNLLIDLIGLTSRGNALPAALLLEDLDAVLGPGHSAAALVVVADTFGPVSVHTAFPSVGVTARPCVAITAAFGIDQSDTLTGPNAGTATRIVFADTLADVTIHTPSGLMSFTATVVSQDFGHRRRTDTRSRSVCARRPYIRRRTRRGSVVMVGRRSRRRRRGRSDSSSLEVQLERRNAHIATVAHYQLNGIDGASVQSREIGESLRRLVTSITRTIVGTR
jgi:hypothetical protein